MNLPEIAARVSFAAAAAISAPLARRVPSYRPVAETLVGAVVLDAVRGALPNSPLDPALLLAFPCLSASLAIRVLGELPRWPAAVAWGVLAVLTLSPACRRFLEPQERLYGVVHVVGLGVQLSTVWLWSRRHPSRSHPERPLDVPLLTPRRADELPEDVEVGVVVDHTLEDAHRTVSDRSDTVAPFAVLVLLTGDLAALFGPFASGHAWRDWYVAHAQVIVLFAAFNAWQVWQLWRSRVRDV